MLHKTESIVLLLHGARTGQQQNSRRIKQYAQTVVRFGMVSSIYNAEESQ